ncbi:ISNCY family transposase [Marinimicrobium koreense]|jgi:IS5 family transposase|uniref:ISNCY family transposase n=1 Tax=Marinimicrobium koreense TaxID=306545 RepID=UPI003F700E79
MRESRTVQRSLFDLYSPHKFGAFLGELSRVLDDHPEILPLLEEDFRAEGTQATGRKGLSVESTFRCMLLKQITGVSYEMLAFHLADSSSYRAFARLERDCRPGKSALSGNIRRLRPKTLQSVFQQLGNSAFEQGVMKTDCLRIDSTVVSSNIASPSDSKLLDDGIRVLSRLMAKSRDCTGIKLRLTDYRKRSKSLAARIFYGKKADKETLYPELTSLANRVLKQSDKAVEQVRRQGGEPTHLQSWIDQVVHYQALLERVVDQTKRRVLKGEKVPASQKIVSLFEPHTDIIIKGPREIEYGHKINLATDRNGLITALMIEKGNPTDVERFMPVVGAHQSLYGGVPETTIADGGYASVDNIEKGKALGIKRVGFHKKRGISLSAMGLKEKTLKKLRDFRAGVEGNISELKRAFGASKALWKGEDGFMSFVWASVISYNLTRLVRLNSG